MAKNKHKPTRAITKKPNKLGPQPSQLAGSTAERKLDLACGQTPKQGFEGVDLHAPNAMHKVDLSTFPWPFEDNSIDELFCSHYIEHILMGYVDNAGNQVPEGHPEAKDALFKFFDECYRILKPNGWLEIHCPSARSHRGFQDPTHRRFIVGETFSYLWAEWRKINKLDHYKVDCDFGGSLNFTTNADMQTKHPEAQALPLSSYWNVIHDWIVRLQAYKPARTTPAAPAAT